MKKLLLLALITIVTCISVAHAEISKEKRKQVEKMIRLTGMEKLMDQIKTQLISGMKTQSKNLPEGFWEKFEQKLDVNGLLEKLIPVYDKYYTVEDLKAINAFYESPVGQRMLSTLPQVMQESMKIGKEWGGDIGQQAAHEAEEELKKK